MSETFLSIIIPTRERAAYLPHTINTCLRSDRRDMEVLVLDNASGDDTLKVLSRIDDERLRVQTSDARLSMRDNFERGLNLARGEVLCYIGDDDGLVTSRLDVVVDIFRSTSVQAVSAARAHYAWPDLRGGRRNSLVVPRHDGISIECSKSSLHSVLKDSNYYRVPCLYHGFVRRDLVDRITRRQGRFFLSSQVDIYSAIALSMEDVPFAYCKRPFIINGGSGRSNGASHLKGGAEQEKQLWMKEDELGFLPGFAEWQTMGTLLIESAIRFAEANRTELSNIFASSDITAALARDAALRRAADHEPPSIAQMWERAGVTPAREGGSGFASSRIKRILHTFAGSRPMRAERHGIHDVDAAARWVDEALSTNAIGWFDEPFDQIAAAFRMARG